eukprot:365294-Chlamydomonas_euryale.AAC.12
MAQLKEALGPEVDEVLRKHGECGGLTDMVRWEVCLQRLVVPWTAFLLLGLGARLVVGYRARSVVRWGARSLVGWGAWLVVGWGARRLWVT